MACVASGKSVLLLAKCSWPSPPSQWGLWRWIEIRAVNEQDILNKCRLVSRVGEFSLGLICTEMGDAASPYPVFSLPPWRACFPVRDPRVHAMLYNSGAILCIAFCLDFFFFNECMKHILFTYFWMKHILISALFLTWMDFFRHCRLTLFTAHL